MHLTKANETKARLMGILHHPARKQIRPILPLSQPMWGPWHPRWTGIDSMVITRYHYIS